MSPIKRTYKMQQLRDLFASHSIFKEIDLSEEHWTNEAAIAVANSAGYSWSVQKHEWFYSPDRVRRMAVKVHVENQHGGTGKRVLVRFMGPKDGLARLAGDFAEVAELIGVKVLSISEVKENGDNSEWGRLYVTVEEM